MKRGERRMEKGRERGREIEIEAGRDKEVRGMERKRGRERWRG